MVQWKPKRSATGMLTLKFHPMLKCHKKTFYLVFQLVYDKIPKFKVTCANIGVIPFHMTPPTCN